MDIAYIKSKAKSIFIEEIKETQNEIIFKFAEGDTEYIKIFKELMKKYKDLVVLKFGLNPYFYIRLKDVTKENKLQLLKEVFNDIIL